MDSPTPHPKPLWPHGLCVHECQGHVFFTRTWAELATRQPEPSSAGVPGLG